MNKQILSLTMIATTILSCHLQPSTSGLITGTYAREYSFDQVNLDMNKSIGNATIRDTIFIIADGDNFKVSNSMWRKNDYDDRGWYQLGTNSSGAFHAYAAKWSEADSTLNPLNFGVMNPIRADVKNGKIFLGKTEYEKVK